MYSRPQKKKYVNCANETKQKEQEVSLASILEIGFDGGKWYHNKINIYN